MNIKTIFFSTILLLPLAVAAQKNVPSATYIDENNNSVETTSDFTSQAPFRKEGTTQDVAVRYEENTQYTFMESGTFVVTLKARFTDCDIPIDSTTIKVTISESRLEFPNAFSPNDDHTNDIYGAKGVNDPNSPNHYRSIVEFHAYIFNRWGQKLFEWNDVSKGWDGTYKGHPVKEGVYFVLVKAKGADGREYNIRKDINLLRGYTEGQTQNTQP